VPSFDIVSKLNLAEVDNALNQANQEVVQRYDFKGTDTILVREGNMIKIESADDFKVKAVLDVLQTKLTKRGVSLKALKAGKIEPGPKGRAKQQIDLIDGIDQERAKELVRKIKDSKLKVQAAIQGTEVRVTGKKKDDLQASIALCRQEDFPLALQFVNFRD